jgi:hypothetical protein
MKLIAAIALLIAAAPSWAAEIYTFGLLPQSGRIGGAPGTTIGWGYSIENESTDYWLVTTNLATGPFAFGTPQVLFDFPILAPGASVTVPFDYDMFAGLFALTWDKSAPAGTIESGTFVLDAEWWTGDPFGDGAPAFAATPANRPYEALVTPEPATTGLMAVALVGGIAAALRRRRRN